MNPVADLATLVATSLGLTVGESVFRGPIRPPGTDVARDSIFVRLTGGPAPTRYQDGNTDDAAQLQILVRGADYLGTEAMALSLVPALGGSPPAGYMDLRCVQSVPAYVGQDQDGLHLFSLNVRLTYPGG